MTLEELRANHREAILQITARYGIENVRVFGSVLRGDTSEDSDLDLLVTLTQPLGLDFFGCKHELEEYLKLQVDLVSDGSLDKYIGPYIIQEARTL